jgi:hypothetical protein
MARQPTKECVLVKEAPYGTVLVKTGTHSFSTKLVEGGLISRHDLAVAEQHALREQLHLVDAVVALGCSPSACDPNAPTSKVVTRTVPVTQSRR